MKEDSKKQNKETEQKKWINENEDDEQNQPLNLPMKLPSTLMQHKYQLKTHIPQFHTQWIT